MNKIEVSEEEKVLTKLILEQSNQSREKLIKDREHLERMPEKLRAEYSCGTGHNVPMQSFKAAPSIS